jgi:hypothetical protein
MPTPERCRARADEAERLAGIVSYGRDKERLLAQAVELRERAVMLEAAEIAPVPTPPEAPARLPPWLRRWLPGRKAPA